MARAVSIDFRININNDKVDELERINIRDLDNDEYHYPKNKKKIKNWTRNKKRAIWDEDE